MTVATSRLRRLRAPTPGSSTLSALGPSHQQSQSIPPQERIPRGSRRTARRQWRERGPRSRTGRPGPRAKSAEARTEFRRGRTATPRGGWPYGSTYRRSGCRPGLLRRHPRRRSCWLAQAAANGPASKGRPKGPWYRAGPSNVQVANALALRARPTALRSLARRALRLEGPRLVATGRGEHQFQSPLHRSTRCLTAGSSEPVIELRSRGANSRVGARGCLIAQWHCTRSCRPWGGREAKKVVAQLGPGHSKTTKKRGHEA